MKKPLGYRIMTEILDRFRFDESTKLNEGIIRLCLVISIIISITVFLVVGDKIDAEMNLQNIETIVETIVFFPFAVIITVIVSCLAFFGSLLILLYLCAVVKWIKDGFNVS